MSTLRVSIAVLSLAASTASSHASQQPDYGDAQQYRTTLARFLAGDPVQFSPERPDMFNRYAYAANDPVNLFDPDGRAPNQAGAAGYNQIASQIRGDGGLAGLAATLGNSGRYFHTSRVGWVDVRHFGTAAGMKMNGVPGSVVKTLGYGTEVYQTVGETVRGASYRSGFSPEDLNSNAAGVDFAVFANGYDGSIADAFVAWAEANGALTSDSEAFLAAVEALPETDPAVRGNGARGSASTSNSGGASSDSSGGSSSGGSWSIDGDRIMGTRCNGRLDC